MTSFRVVVASISTLDKSVVVLAVVTAGFKVTGWRGIAEVGTS